MLVGPHLSAMLAMAMSSASLKQLADAKENTANSTTEAKVAATAPVIESRQVRRARERQQAKMRND